MRRLVTANWKIITVPAGLIPLLVLVTLLARYAVNVPFEDEWSETAALKGFAHVPTLAYLFSQHNEHRVALPRLILWVSTAIAHGDLRCAMAVTLAVAILNSILAMVLLQRTLPDGQPWQVWWLAINLLILSPVQYHNWFWAFQVAFYLPIAGLLAGLVVIEVLPDGWRQTLLCMLLAVLAAFSMTNGLLVAVLLPLVMLVRRPGFSRARLLAWGVFVVGLGLGYFHAWHWVIGHTEPHWCIGHPLAAACFFLVFLSAGLGWGHGVWLPMVIGALLLGLWLIPLGYVVWHRQPGKLLPKASPWLAVGGFALASAAMTTWGRAGFGLEQAGESRYTTTALLLVVAAVGLWPMVLATLPARRLRRAAVVFSALAAGGLLSCFFSTQVRSVHALRLEWAKRLRGQAGLELTHYLNSGVLFATLFPFPPDIYPEVAALNDLGRLHPAVLPDNCFTSITSATPAQGRFQECIARLDGAIHVRGTACLPNGRSADCVVFTFDNEIYHGAVVWLSCVPITKAETAALTAPEAASGSWQDVIPADHTPPGHGTLTAWAFDATNRTAYRLEQSHAWRQKYLRYRYFRLLQP